MSKLRTVMHYSEIPIDDIQEKKHPDFTSYCYFMHFVKTATYLFAFADIYLKLMGMSLHIGGYIIIYTSVKIIS